VRNLLSYATLKLLCLDIGVIQIERKRELVTMKFRENAAIDPGKLARFVASQRGAQFTPDGTLKFTLKVKTADGVLQTMYDLLEELAAGEPSARPA
jgi:transcription-repair coupling factor (superfamily II helicase)